MDRTIDPRSIALDDNTIKVLRLSNLLDKIPVNKELYKKYSTILKLEYDLKEIENDIINYFKKSDQIAILDYTIYNNKLKFTRLIKIKDFEELKEILEKNPNTVFFVLHSHMSFPELSFPHDISTLIYYKNMILGIYIIKEKTVKFYLLPYVVLFEKSLKSKNLNHNSSPGISSGGLNS